MVVIRLSFAGTRNRRFFYIVVSDSRSRRDGRFIEKIGFYNPIAKGKAEVARLAKDRLDYWTARGAQMSDTVRRLATLPSATLSAASA